VEEAERKFQAADLDLRLKDLDAAKQRQVCEIAVVLQQGKKLPPFEFLFSNF
jgi:hypothetical protein